MISRLRENPGSIPPHTVLMIIRDGDKRYEVNVSSSKSSNAVVSFTLKNRQITASAQTSVIPSHLP